MQECEVLYHYTTLDAFVNIVKTKEFRLFDITKTNDPFEGKYILEALKKVCSISTFFDSKLNDDQYLLARRSFFEFEQEVYNHNSFKDFYAAASFCVPHHELMMLRSYADNGRGVSVGIARTTLENLAKKIPDIEFKKVQYLSEADLENRAMNFWIDTISNFKIRENDIHNADLSPIVNAIKKEYKEGFFIKSEPNKDEEEYRLLYQYKDLFDLHLPTIPIDVPEEVDFISTRDDIKAYYRIPVGNNEKDLLHFDYIFLGPLCKVTVSEIQVFLQKNGISVNGISDISNIQMR